MTRGRVGVPNPRRLTFGSFVRFSGYATVLVFTVLVLFVGTFLLRNEMRKRAFTDCLKEPQRGSLITLRFDWWSLPPGYRCVYRNKAGEIIREESP